MQKTVALLTFHRAHNYGAVLQCLALQEFLKSKGISVTVIDYRSRIVEQEYEAQHLIRNRQPVNYIKYILRKRTIKIRAVNFNDFLKKFIDLSNPCYQKEQMKSLCNTFDMIIVGSDQVWNKNIIKNDMVYLLDFKIGPQTKKCSYAVSFGKGEEVTFEDDAMIACMNRMDGISFREDILPVHKDRIEKGYVINIDPTLLMEKEFWNRYTLDKTEGGKYLLFFEIGRGNSNNYKFAKRISRSKGLKLVYLSSDDRIYKYIFEKHILCAKPQEFLGWIKNADIVVTNSFHGTAFSIIFQKEFYSERNSRTEFLMKKLKIRGHLINNGMEIEKREKIDWSRVKKILEKEKESAGKFLEKVLDESKEDGTL